MQKWLPIDALGRSLQVRCAQDSLDPAQETFMSLDFGQISVDLESIFLDSDRACPEDRCHQAEKLGLERGGSPDPANSLLLSLNDFQAGEARPGEV